MAESTNWRSSLTSSERYDNIQKLTTAIAAAGLDQSAFSLEDEAYRTASSREEYDAACNLGTATPESHPPSPPFSPAETDDTNSDPGVTIGPFQNCHYIASGITAEVYRCKIHALKVIVNTHNIEPHNPHREAAILISLRSQNAPNIITLFETFHDQHQHFVLVFPYMPLTLSHLISTQHPLSSPLPSRLLRPIFIALFRALHHLHTNGIIHRDVKPSAILLSSPTPASPSDISLSDFGTAYHPRFSPASEPPSQKVLEIGTGPYRAPETLFGNRTYSAAVDLWAAGTTLAECLLRRPLFDSPPAHEDGNQLGLILSIFQTLGTPTEETWPEARRWRTKPFGMWRVWEGRVKEAGWEGLLPGVGERWRRLVEGLVRFESGERVKAVEALEFKCLKGESEGGGRSGLEVE
ncbi:hypothetical protein VTI74DRAFT_11089 [Chaetomium olivicolor]